MLEWSWMLDRWRLGSPFGYAHARKIANAAANGREALARTRDQEARIDDLERQVDRLTLTGMALWAFLRDKHGLSEADLLAKIEAIDLGDGSLDAIVGMPAAQRCTACRRVVSGIHEACIYCGSKALEPNPTAP